MFFSRNKHQKKEMKEKKKSRRVIFPPLSLREEEEKERKSPGSIKNTKAIFIVLLIYFPRSNSKQFFVFGIGFHSSGFSFSKSFLIFLFYFFFLSEKNW